MDAVKATICEPRPTAGAGSGSNPTVLPEVERESVVRLRALVLVLGALQLGGLVLNATAPALWGWDQATSRIGVAMTAALLAVSLGFLVLIERGRLAPRRILALGLVYEAVIAFGLALGEQAQLQPHRGLSVVALLILLFPLFVPSSPRRTLVAALGAATAALLAHVAHWMLGPGQVAPGDWVEHAFNYAAAFVAIVPAHVVDRFTRDVSRARRMGSYELLEKLGSGGMGEVWRARHRMLRRPAAIKLLSPKALGVAEPDQATRLIDRFEREAQVTATLESPHSIELYDFGVTDKGTLYHVVELLEGIDLDQLVRAFGPLPPERVIHILLQLCDSLDDAHRKGMVHRDVKPANIYLTRRGRRHDFVKLLDFGLVKVVEPSGALALLSTIEGEVQGTPAFLAPEIARGQAVDGRADLYALGCVAHWLLTGTLLFDDVKTPVQMAVAHTTREPERPSARSPEPVPAALEDVVMACLAKAPEDRPRTAQVLAQSLERARAELPQRWTDARAAAWWRAHLPALSLPGEPHASEPSASGERGVAPRENQESWTVQRG